jgi:hypothetical protein
VKVFAHVKVARTCFRKILKGQENHVRTRTGATGSETVCLRQGLGRQGGDSDFADPDSRFEISEFGRAGAHASRLRI